MAELPSPMKTEKFKQSLEEATFSHFSRTIDAVVERGKRLNVFPKSHGAIGPGYGASPSAIKKGDNIQGPFTKLLLLATTLDSVLKRSSQKHLVSVIPQTKYIIKGACKLYCEQEGIPYDERQFDRAIAHLLCREEPPEKLEDLLSKRVSDYATDG